jgi:hypothetical protein
MNSRNLFEEEDFEYEYHEETDSYFLKMKTRK